MDEERLLADFLPIVTTSAEADYISHLWEVYDALLIGDNTSVSYAIMPYHLLYILALNYKVLRMIKTHEKYTRLFFCVGSGRNKKNLLSSQVSVAEIALINERTIPELFRIIDLDDEVIKRIKNIVDYRNETLGHPKLIIEAKPEDRIKEYLDTLSKLAHAFKDENVRLVQNVLKDIEEYDDISLVLDDFFRNYYITPTDLGDMMTTLLMTEGITFEQWQVLISKSLEINDHQTRESLLKIAQHSTDDKLRYSAIEILDVNSLLDIDMAFNLLRTEKDPEIVEYLKNNCI